jgi:hypothetical protein
MTDTAIAIRQAIERLPAGDPRRQAALRQFQPMAMGEATMAAAPARMPRHRAGEMNKTEHSYSQRLDVQKAAGEVQWWLFERAKLRLAMPGSAGRGIWLTVDFLVCLAGGELVWDEVKGGYITEDG